MSITVTEPDLAAEALPVEANVVSRRVAEAAEQVGADVILGEIKRNCFIIYVTIRSWRGQYLMRNADVVIDGKKVDDKLSTRGQWKVMPEKWHKALQPFESKCRAAIYKLGVTFKDGVYIVPKTRAKGLVDEIKRIRVEYKAKVREFQAEWPALVGDLERKITADLGEDQWLMVSKLIPDARKLPDLFDIEIGLWPVGSGGIPVECFDDLERASHQVDAVQRLIDRLHANSTDASADEDAGLLGTFLTDVRGVIEKVNRAGGKVIEENAEQWMSEAQSATNRMVGAAVEAMIQEPVKEFSAAVENLQKLAESRTVRAGTLDAIRRAYQKLQGFSFMLPADLMQRLQAVELRLGAADPRALNAGSVAGSTLTASLRAISDELGSDVNQLQAFGQFARHLDI